MLPSTTERLDSSYFVRSAVLADQRQGSGAFFSLFFAIQGIEGMPIHSTCTSSSPRNGSCGAASRAARKLVVIFIDSDL